MVAGTIRARKPTTAARGTHRGGARVRSRPAATGLDATAGEGLGGAGGPHAGGVDDLHQAQRVPGGAVEHDQRVDRAGVEVELLDRGRVGHRGTQLDVDRAGRDRRVARGRGEGRLVGQHLARLHADVHDRGGGGGLDDPDASLAGGRAAEVVVEHRRADRRQLAQRLEGVGRVGLDVGRAGHDRGGVGRGAGRAHREGVVTGLEREVLRHLAVAETGEHEVLGAVEAGDVDVGRRGVGREVGHADPGRGDLGAGRAGERRGEGHDRGPQRDDQSEMTSEHGDPLSVGAGTGAGGGHGGEAGGGHWFGSATA